MVNHDALALAAHTQAGFVRTAMIPPLPLAVNGLERLLVSKLTSHVRPGWVTWKGWPPIDRLADRAAMVEFGSTVKASVPPGPVPVAPDCSAIHAGPAKTL